MAQSSASCCEPPVYLESAVAFPSNQRPHISINMPEIASSRPFYVALFGVEPVKEVADYIKWEPVSPPVNFTLNQHPPELASTEDLGVECDDPEHARAIAARLRAVGANVKELGRSNYVTADKYGNRWEIMVRKAR